MKYNTIRTYILSQLIFFAVLASAFSEPTTENPGATVIIKAKPANAQIFFDGKMVGRGTCELSNIPPGKHHLFITNGEYSHERSFYLGKKQVYSKKIELHRNNHFDMSSSFSHFWADKRRAMGPSLDFGFKFNKVYLGINYHWDGFESYPRKDYYYGSMYGGAGLQSYFDVFTLQNILSVSIGACSGFWYKNRNDLYFLGSSCRISVGYKHIFANVAYTTLYGNSLGHLLVFGIRVQT